MPGGLARRKTVLVVEDDRPTSDMLRALVEEEGFRCVPASEGQTALELARVERPSLITLDLNLPDTDGHAVLHQLLSDDRTRQIPIVVVTGFPKFLPPADRCRVVRVLGKPLDIEELASVLRSAAQIDGLP